MKALILAGGRGNRLKKFTKNKNKSLVNLFGKSLIEYNLDQAIKAKVSEIIIVIGYKGDEIKKRIGKGYKGIKIKYVLQKKQRGLVNAISCAKSAIGKEDFILFLADEIVIKPKLKEMIKKFQRENMFVLCGICLEKDKANIGKTYSAMVNEKGRIFRLIEKPKFPINKIKGTGHCVMKNQIFEYIKKTPINMKRGEKELVDMIQEAVDEGKKVYVYPITDNYVNINTEEDFNLAQNLIKKSNPSILIIHTQMKFLGGAELLIIELANWLTKKGIKNDLFVLSKSKEIENKLIDTKIIIPKHNLSLEPPGFKNISTILKFIKIYRKTLKKIIKNYDVINFHNFPVTWTLFPKKKPCVWMLNEPPNLWSKPKAGPLLKILNKLRNLIDRVIIKKSVDIICVADEFNKKRAFEKYKKNSRIVYYGVNYNFFSKGEAKNAVEKWGLNKKFVIIHPGVITKVKNQLESLKTLKQLKGKIPNLLLIFAGKIADEKYKKELDNYIKKNKLNKKVLFTGNLNRKNLRDLYKSCNVGLFPTGKQGGWLTPFETLCSAKPIIVSKELGAASIIKQFNLGIVTNNYSEKLIEIYNNPKKYNKLAKNASLFIKKNFGWDIFTDKLIKAYKDSWNK